MKLSAKLVSYFSREIRERGQKIYRARLVTIADGSETEVAAEVQGTYLYEVALIWEEAGANGLTSAG